MNGSSGVPLQRGGSTSCRAGKLSPWAARRHDEEAQSKSAFVLEVGSEEMLSKDAGDGGWKNDQRTVRLRGG